jgi:hypothetical protein
MPDTQARMLTVVRTTGRSLSIEAGAALDVGVDAHKETSSVAHFSDGRGLITTRVKAARPEVLIGRPRPPREVVARVVGEAAPTGVALARRPRAEVFTARVIAPPRLPAPVDPEARTDRVARLSARRLFHQVRVPAEREEAGRHVRWIVEQRVPRRPRLS